MTPQMQTALAFIRHYIAEHDGVAPSYEDIGVHLGVRSRSSVYRIVNELEQRGYVRRLFGQARSIQLVEGPTREAMETWSSEELERVRGSAYQILADRARREAVSA